MAKKEPFYQVGICPNCSDEARQRFVFAVNECSGEMVKGGMRYVYGDVHTLSLFRCDGCNAIVMYRTYYADAVEIEEADKLDPTWIFKLDDLERDSNFTKYSSRLYPTQRVEPKPNERVEARLPTLRT